MKVSFFTKWTLGLAAGWLMAVPLAWSGPGSGKTIETLLQEEKTELEELKRKISRQDQELSKIGRQETSLLKTLGRLDDRLGLRERELRIYEWNIQINKKQIKKVALQLAAMEQRLQQQKKTLGARLRSMYKQGGLLPVRILFSAESPGSLLRRFEYLERVMSYDAAVFRGYQSRLHRLREERLALLEVKNNLIRFEKAAQSKKQELEKEARAKSAFLKKVVSQKKYTRQARKEFVQASENLNQLVARLQEKLVIGEGLSLADRKGRLRPPVPGSIITRFGRTKDPGIGTFVVHNGIDFKVPSGTPVRAVFPGKVLFAGTLEGYGHLVIIGHGDNYHSLYGHLSRIRVKVGDNLDAGKIIGVSGDTGSLVGPTLYLELRHHGKPLDPRGWFLAARK